MEDTDIYDFLDSERIYNKLDSIRRAQDLKIATLAKRAGVSAASIYKWRDKKSSPSLSLLESLCDALEISIINLLITSDDLRQLSDDEKQLLAF